MGHRPESITSHNLTGRRAFIHASLLVCLQLTGDLNPFKPLSTLSQSLTNISIECGTSDCKLITTSSGLPPRGLALSFVPPETLEINFLGHIRISPVRTYLTLIR
jgi:hypothetical protein